MIVHAKLCPSPFLHHQFIVNHLMDNNPQDVGQGQWGRIERRILKFVIVFQFAMNGNVG